MIRNLTCGEFVEFLWRYIEGDAEGDEALEFERHLAACPTCVSYVNGYRQTMKLGKTAFESLEAPVPDEVPEGVVRGILAAIRKA